MSRLTQLHWLADLNAPYSSEAPGKRKKAQQKSRRKWGDEPVSESEMDSLDFSADKNLKHDDSSADLSSLVDNNALGTRNADGMYQVPDWDFSKKTDAAIQGALSSSVEEKPDSRLGSLFARLTGSKMLSQEDLKPVLEGMKQHLMAKNVAKEISDKICQGVGESLVGKKVGSFQSVSFMSM